MRCRGFMIAAVVTTMLAAFAGADSLGIELRFDRFNGVHENLVAEVEPIRTGPMTVRLASPENRLELESNQLGVAPLDGGLHELTVHARFSGAGSLDAALDFGGIPATLHDQVVFPVQETEVTGKVRIEAVDSGYLLTAEELPGFVTVEIRSALGAELVAWCKRVALFVAGDAGCDALEHELSHPRLPLPAPGTEYLVRYEELTAEERAQIDLYLTRF